MIDPKELDELWEHTGMEEPHKITGEDVEDVTTSEEMNEILAAFRELEDHDQQGPEPDEE
jgi:hypothetical protein